MVEDLLIQLTQSSMLTVEIKLETLLFRNLKKTDSNRTGVVEIVKIFQTVLTDILSSVKTGHLVVCMCMLELHKAN